MTIIDPSHVATINHFMERGIQVTPANNSSLMPRSKDKARGNLVPQKDVMGIDLVKYGFDIQKILIHESCINLIAQIESNEFEYNENTGKLAIKKINDDLLDPLRYIVNTVLGGTQYWENSEGKEGELNGENVLQGIFRDEGTQRKEWNMDEAILKAQQELNRQIGGDAIFGYKEDNRANTNERDDGLWFLGTKF